MLDLSQRAGAPMNQPEVRREELFQACTPLAWIKAHPAKLRCGCAASGWPRR